MRNLYFICGGSWDDYPRVVRVALRVGYPPDLRSRSLGLRLVRSR